MSVNEENNAEEEEAAPQMENVMSDVFSNDMEESNSNQRLLVDHDALSQALMCIEEEENQSVNVNVEESVQQQQQLPLEDESINEDDDDDDDDDVIMGMENAIPQPQIPQQSVMHLDNQDPFARFCNENGIGHLLYAFRNNGFDDVRVLVRMNREDLSSIGLRLGEAMKCEMVFEEYLKKDDDDSTISNESYGNIHYERSKQSGSVGRSRIKSKYNSNISDEALKIKLRDKVFDIMLNGCNNTTNCKKIRTMVDNRTKNGDIATIRYIFDDATGKWPNSPVHLCYTASQRLQEVNLITVENELFTDKGPGGHPNWSGILRRNTLSSAWNSGTPEIREKLYKFVKNCKGVEWSVYAHTTDDYLNCQALGLIGFNDPDFNATLEEIIALNVD